MIARRYAVLLGILLSTPALADLTRMTSDGWYSWRVEAVADAPDWCCYSWNSGKPYRAGCDLDSRPTGYGPSDDSRFSTGQMQVYARLEDGAVRRVQALSSRCPVTSRTAPVDLGIIPNADSVQRLRREAAEHTRVSSHALAAIAVHAGPEALRTLLDIAKDNQDLENRKDAVFWLGQVRASDAEAEIEQLMFADPEAAFREHAAFSLSQSDAPGRADALARLGRVDPDDEVRAQAWFWLAQTDSAGAAGGILNALGSEQSEHVRHQAIFALSQLEEDGAIKALVSVIENRRLDEDDRKQALFWLAQIDSDPALNYIDQLLSDN